jgi:hypothetical protein
MVKINPLYLKDKTIAAAHAHFLSQHPKNIQLQDFLTVAEISSLGWKKIDEPEKRKYAEAKYDLPIELVQFISKIVGKRLKVIYSGAYEFSHGDYTLLQDEAQPSGILIQLELTPKWDETWGGYTSFVNESGEVVRITPQANTLVIVDQTSKMKHFTKYVNHLSGTQKRVFIQALLK